MKDKKDLRGEVRAIAKKAKEASSQLARLSTGVKNRALKKMADYLEQATDLLTGENEMDLAAGEKANLSRSMMDRLRLSPTVIQGMAGGLREVAPCQ